MPGGQEIGVGGRATGTLVVAVDPDGRIVQVNESWLRFARENGVNDIACISPGANYLEVCRRAMEDGVGEAKSAFDGIESVLKGLQDHFQLNYSFSAARGSKDVEELWYCMEVTRLAGGAGALIIHEDATGRSEKERRFQKSEEYYRAIIENILDVVFIVNREGAIVYVNPAVRRMLGHEPAELHGKMVFDCVHQKDVNRLRRMMRQLEADPETPRTAEIRVRHANGNWRYLDTIGKGLPDKPNGGGAILLSRDTSERREAEVVLKRNERALQRSHAQLRALTGRMLMAEDEARRRISRDLHDDLNQRLAILALDLAAVSARLAGSPVDRIQDDMRELQNEVSKLSEEVRRTAHYLHPSILDDLGLAVAVRSLCEEFTKRHSVQVRFLHRATPETLAPGARASIYRIVQECLWNVAMHAHSDSAVVSLQGTEARLRVSIRDFGVGFDPEAISGKGGLGLISVEERTRLLGGTMRIRSRPGKGCRVVVEVPVERGEYGTSASPAGG